MCMQFFCFFVCIYVCELLLGLVPTGQQRALVPPGTAVTDKLRVALEVLGIEPRILWKRSQCS